MKATVDLITKLQPHFLSVWTFQGWNLAYNVSVEWDAPEDKYEWIKQGIKFLQEGVEQQPQVARPDLGHRLDLLPQARLLRRVDHPPPALLRRRRRRVPVLRRSRDRRQASRSGTTSSSATAGSARAVNLVDAGEARAATGVEANLDYVDPVPAAQGEARRPRLPHDARPRADPLRRAAGEDEHPGHPRHLRRGRQERVGQGARRMGQVRHLRVRRRTTTTQRRRFRARSASTTPRTRSGSTTLSENQKYWTDPLERPDELPLLEGAVAGGDDRRGGPGPAELLRGDPGLPELGLRHRGQEVQGRPDDLGRPDEELRRLSQRRPQPEGHRDRPQALPAGARPAVAQGDSAVPDDLPFKELLEGPAPTIRPTRSTPPRCSAPRPSRT